MPENALTRKWFVKVLSTPLGATGIDRDRFLGKLAAMDGAPRLLPIDLDELGRGSVARWL